MTASPIEFERVNVEEGYAPRPETIDDMERKEVRLGPECAWTEYLMSTASMTLSISSTSSSMGNLRVPEEEADCWALRFGFKGEYGNFKGQMAFFIVCPTPEMCLYEYGAWLDYHVNSDGVCRVGMD